MSDAQLPSSSSPFSILSEKEWGGGRLLSISTSRGWAGGYPTPTSSFEFGCNKYDLPVSVFLLLAYAPLPTILQFLPPKYGSEPLVPSAKISKSLQYHQILWTKHFVTSIVNFFIFNSNIKSWWNIEYKKWTYFSFLYYYSSCIMNMHV